MRLASSGPSGERSLVRRPLPAKVFRFHTLLILSCYVAPLLGVIVLAMVYHLSRLPGQLTPLGLLAIVTAGAFCVWVLKRSTQLRHRIRPRRELEHPQPIGERPRGVILRHFPELQRLQFESGKSHDDLLVSRRTLRIGSQHLVDLIKNEQFSDALFFFLAHEARHVAVDAFGAVVVFRALRDAYPFVVLSLHLAFLLNWLGTWDDADRTAFLIYLCLAPYLWAALYYVLDEAMAAFEWRLELDADRAARERFEAARGRPPKIADWLLKQQRSLRIADGHPPSLLRISAVRGSPFAWAIVHLVLGAGLVVTLIPLAMTVLFTMTGWEDPESIRLWIGITNIAVFAVAAVALAVVAKLGPHDRPSAGSPVPTLLEGTSLIAMRLYSLAASFLFFGMVFFDVGIAILLAIDLLWGHLTPSVDVILGIVALTGAAAIYYRVAWRVSVRWILGSALVEWLRLVGMSWFILATGALPFFDDVGALGSAIRDHPDLLHAEMIAILQDRPSVLIAIGSIWGAFALSMALLSSKGLQVHRRFAHLGG